MLLDKSFQLKILIARIIIINEINKKNISEEVNEIRENYSVLLKTKDHNRDKLFLEIIIKKLNSGDLEKDKNEFLSIISDDDSKEVDIIGYNNWVKENI